MGIGIFSEASQKKVSIYKVLSGTLMISGTTIGAGMLGIPLFTAEAGFLPAVVITTLVWLFMLATGLLLLEVSLWMPEGANILSMASRFLGFKGKVLAGGMFIFLYYCLLVAYFAAGAPLLSNFINATLGLDLQGWASYLFYGLIFGGIVSFGARCIDRANIILTTAMVVSYVMMTGIGSSEVQFKYLKESNWSSVFFAVPILFGAFGFHNVVPSLTSYLNRERKPLRLSMILGTSIALVIYLLWQWLVIGSIPKESIADTLSQGLPATAALQAATGSSSLYRVGQYFAFFAIVTSMLGVAFSMVDFLSDGLKISRSGSKRILLCFLTFFPPFLCAVIDPTIFDRALGIAGGFGEAFLNGLLPVCLVWVGRYALKLPTESPLFGGRLTLVLLLAISLFVIGLEAVYLFGG